MAKYDEFGNPIPEDLAPPGAKKILFLRLAAEVEDLLLK